MNDPAKQIFEFGPFRLDRAERVLLRNGRPVPLTLKGFDLLLLLVENSGHLVEKDELMNRVWARTFVEEGNLKATISMLRKALEDNQGDNRYIETVPRRGYRFVAEVRGIVAETVDLVMHERTRESLTIDEAVLIADQPRNRRSLYLGGGVLLILLGVVIGILVFKNWDQSFAPAASASPIKSIAVLPFKPLASDSRDESLEMGITDTLIVKLSRQSQVIVRPISGVRKYAGLDADAVAAGRQQKVDAVLDGSIQKAGDTVRVSVRLVSVSDGRQLWADEFNEKFTDILRVQDSISRQVAESIANLTGKEKELLARRDTEDAEAYSLYVKGRYFWNKRTPDDLNKAIDYFNQAIAKDPTYALAYAGMADAYIVLPGHTSASMFETHPKARAYAQKALEINNQLPEAQVTLASIAADYWQWQEADKLFKQALDLNPNYATAHQWYGEYLVHTGRLDEGFQEFKRAQELDPTSPIISVLLGQVFYLQRRYDEAIRQYQLTLELDREFVTAHWLLGLAFLANSKHEAAISSVEKALSLSGGSPHFMALLAAANGKSGKKSVARNILKKMIAMPEQNGTHARNMALVYIGLGDKQKAFEWLEKAYEDHSELMLYLRVDPFFDSLRSDTRFDDLLRRVAHGGRGPRE